MVRGFPACLQPPSPPHDINMVVETTGAAAAVAALFEGDGICLAEGFKDKVAALHSHFDRDNDGYLNHSELRGLQLITSGNDMHQGHYVMVCKSIGCDPRNGVSIDALRLVYAADGTSIGESVLSCIHTTFMEMCKCKQKHNNIRSLLINNSILFADEDYVKVFGRTASNTTAKTVDTNSEESSDDVILEVGDNGVDISS